MARILLCAALSNLLALGASAMMIVQPKQKQALIPSTDVPMPSDYEDYARSRTTWRLFGSQPPGERAQMPSPGPGLPGFMQLNRTTEPEVFTYATSTDFAGYMCAPGHKPVAHYFYDVWDPELVPFIVDRQRPDFTNASVIIAPGGGNIHLAWEAEGIAQAEWLNSRGISAFVLKYRVPHPGPELGRIDGQRAVVLVRGRAESYGLDPGRVGIMGFSAGGGLAIEVATHTELQYPREDAADSLSPLPDFALFLYPGVDLSIISDDSLRHLPPTFLAYAQDDPCCPSWNTQVFGQLAKNKSSAPFEITEYAEGRHGWASCDYYPQLKGLPMCDWHGLAEKFIRKHLPRS